MKIIHKKILCSLACLILSWGALAMEQDFKTKLEHKFFGFRTIKPEILEKAIRNIPEQSTPWGCGLHSSQATLECAFGSCEKERLQRPSFVSPEDYPLAVSANLKQGIFLLLASSLPNLATDAEGYFRVGASPHDLATYINKYLPNTLNKKAKALSAQALGVNELLAHVEHNIAHNLPTIVYYLTGPMTMHIVCIVGYLENEIMLLETSGEGLERLLLTDAQTLLENMNASTIVNTVNFIDNFGVIKLRELIQQSGGKVLDRETLNEWKAYSLITFQE